MMFDSDPRVEDRDDEITYKGTTTRVSGYRVTTDNGRTFRVLPTGELMGFVWLVCHDEPPFDIVMLPGEQLAMFATADAAITVVLGDPQPAAVPA